MHQRAAMRFGAVGQRSIQQHGLARASFIAFAIVAHICTASAGIVERDAKLFTYPEEGKSSGLHGVTASFSIDLATCVDGKVSGVGSFKFPTVSDNEVQTSVDVDCAILSAGGNGVRWTMRKSGFAPTREIAFPGDAKMALKDCNVVFVVNVADGGVDNSTVTLECTHEEIAVTARYPAIADPVYGNVIYEASKGAGEVQLGKLISRFALFGISLPGGDIINSIVGEAMNTAVAEFSATINSKAPSILAKATVAVYGKSATAYLYFGNFDSAKGPVTGAAIIIKIAVGGVNVPTIFKPLFDMKLNDAFVAVTYNDIRLVIDGQELGFDSGVSLIARLSPEDSSVSTLKSQLGGSEFSKQLSVQQLQIQGIIHSLTNVKFVADLTGNFPIANGVDVKKLSFEVEVNAEPPSITFGFGAVLEVVFGKGTDDQKVVTFEGKVSVGAKPEGITLAFEFSANSAEPWKNPLGISKKVSVLFPLVLKMGVLITAAPPFLVPASFAVAGGLQIGEDPEKASKAQLALSADLTDPSKNVIKFDAKEIKFSALVSNVAGCDDCLGFFAQVMDAYFSFDNISLSFNPTGNAVNIGTSSALIIVQPGLFIDIVNMKIYFVFKIRHAVLKASIGGIEALLDMEPIDFAGIMTIRKYTGPALARRSIVDFVDPSIMGTGDIISFADAVGGVAASGRALSKGVASAVAADMEPDNVGPAHLHDLPRASPRVSSRRARRDEDLPPYAVVILQSTPSVYLRFESTGNGTALINSGIGNPNAVTPTGKLAVDEGYVGNGLIVAPGTTVDFELRSVSDGKASFSEFSVESWVYFSADNAAIKETFVVYESLPNATAPARADRLKVWVTQRASVAVELSETGDFIETRGLTIDTGDWVHIVAVVTLTSVKIYINGFVSASLDRFAVVPLIGGSARLGPYWGEGEHPDPVIVDEYAAYSHALAHEEVWAHFQAFDGADAYSWAVARYMPGVYERFDSVDTAPSAGASDLGGGARQQNTDFDDGIIGDGLVLSTAALSAYTIPETFVTGGGATVEMWVKASQNSTVTGDAPRVLLQGGDSSYFTGVKITVAVSSTGTLMARIGELPLFDFGGRTVGTVWTHIAVTVTDDTVTGYVNGANVGDFKWTTANFLLGPFSAGCAQATQCTGGVFEGIIDEVALYPSTLSDEAIWAHFALLSPSHEAQLSTAVVIDSPDIYLRFEDVGSDVLHSDGSEDYGVAAGPSADIVVLGVLGTSGVVTSTDAIVFTATSDPEADAKNSEAVTVEFWALGFSVALLTDSTISHKFIEGNNYALAFNKGGVEISVGGAVRGLVTASEPVVRRGGDGAGYSQVAVVLTLTDATLIVDGDVVGQASIALPMGSKFDSGVVRMYAGVGVEYMMAIDEFALYPQALTAGRLYNHYVRALFGEKSRGVAISSMGPLVFYRFENTRVLRSYGSVDISDVVLDVDAPGVSVGAPSSMNMPDDGTGTDASQVGHFTGHSFSVNRNGKAPVSFGRFEDGLSFDVIFRLSDIPCSPGHMTVFASDYGNGWTNVGAVSLQVMYAQKKAWLRATAVGGGQVDMFQVQKDTVYELTIIFESDGVSVYGFVPVIGITLVHRALWEPSADPFSFSIDGLRIGAAPRGQDVHDLGLYGEISLFAVYATALTEDDLVPRNWLGATVEADLGDDGSDNTERRRREMYALREGSVAYYERSYTPDEWRVDLSRQRERRADGTTPADDGPQLSMKFSAGERYLKANGAVSLLKTIDARVVLEIRDTELYGEAGFRFGSLFSLTFLLRSKGFPGGDGFMFSLTGTFESNVWEELKKAGVAVAQQFAESATQQLDKAKASIGDAKAKLEEANQSVERERQRINGKFSDAQNSIRDKRNSVANLRASCDDYNDNCKWYKPWNCIAYAGCWIGLKIAEAVLSAAEAVVGAVSFVADAAFQLAEAAVSAAQSTLTATQKVLDGCTVVVNALPGLLEGLLSFLGKVFNIRKAAFETTLTNTADTIGYDIDATILGVDINLKGQITLSFEGIKNWIVDQVREAIKKIGGGGSRRSIDGGYHVTAEMLHAQGVVDMTRFPHLGGRHVRTIGKTIETAVVCVAGMSVFDGSKQSFVGEIPGCLFAIDALKSLYLTGNALSGVIPEFDNKAHNIEYLGLADNSLTGPIPATISKATKLRWLDVSGNVAITGTLTPLETLAYLEYVDISHTAIPFSVDNVVRSLGRLPRLRYYDVRGVVPPASTAVSATKPDAIEVTIVAELPQSTFCSACDLAVKQAGTCASNACSSGNLALEKAAAYIKRKLTSVAGAKSATVTVTGTFALGDEYTVIKAAVGGIPDADTTASMQLLSDMPSAQDSNGGLRVYYQEARPKCAAGLFGKDCSFFCPYSWQRYSNDAASVSQKMVDASGFEASVRIVLDNLSPRCFIPDTVACGKNVTVAVQTAVDVCINYIEGTAAVGRCADAIDAATQAATDFGVSPTCASEALGEFAKRVDADGAASPCAIAEFEAVLSTSDGTRVGSAVVAFERASGSIKFIVEADATADFTALTESDEDDVCGVWRYGGSDDDGDDVGSIEIMEGSAGFPGETLLSWTAAQSGLAIGFGSKGGVCVTGQWADADLEDWDLRSDIRATKSAASVFQYQFVVKTRGNPDGAFLGTLKWARCSTAVPSCKSSCVASRACANANGACGGKARCEEVFVKATDTVSATTTAQCNCLNGDNPCTSAGVLAPLPNGNVIACGPSVKSRCVVSEDGGRRWIPHSPRVDGNRATILGGIARPDGAPDLLYRSAAPIGRERPGASESDRCLVLAEKGGDNERLVPPNFADKYVAPNHFSPSVRPSLDGAQSSFPTEDIPVFEAGGALKGTVGVSSRGIFYRDDQSNWRMRGAWMCGADEGGKCSGPK